MDKAKPKGRRSHMIYDMSKTEPLNLDFHEIVRIQKADDRKADAERAMIELAKNNKPNWPQRHPLLMLLIGAILGFLFAYILELLKGNHLAGLK